MFSFIHLTNNKHSSSSSSSRSSSQCLLLLLVVTVVAATSAQSASIQSGAAGAGAGENAYFFKDELKQTTKGVAEGKQQKQQQHVINEESMSAQPQQKQDPHKEMLLTFGDELDEAAMNGGASALSGPAQLAASAKGLSKSSVIVNRGGSNGGAGGDMGAEATEVIKKRYLSELSGDNSEMHAAAQQKQDDSELLLKELSLSDKTPDEIESEILELFGGDDEQQRRRGQLPSSDDDYYVDDDDDSNVMSDRELNYLANMIMQAAAAQEEYDDADEPIAVQVKEQLVHDKPTSQQQNERAYAMPAEAPLVAHAAHGQNKVSEFDIFSNNEVLEDLVEKLRAKQQPEQDDGLWQHFHLLKKQLFLIVVSGFVLAGVVAIVAAGTCWYTMNRSRGGNVEGGLKGSGLGRDGSAKSTASDRRLAQSAQMYHYQHQRQQIIAMEKAKNDSKQEESDASDAEGEEGDYTVYECPGLAPTGEMEVKNPLFKEEFSASSHSIHQQQTQQPQPPAYSSITMSPNSVVTGSVEPVSASTPKNNN